MKKYNELKEQAIELIELGNVKEKSIGYGIMKVLQSPDFLEICKERLRFSGYNIDTCWHVDDVTINYDVSEDEAEEILTEALNKADNESVMIQIDLEAAKRGHSIREEV